MPSAAGVAAAGARRRLSRLRIGIYGVGRRIAADLRLAGRSPPVVAYWWRRQANYGDLLS
jgi:hypothetical protein